MPKEDPAKRSIERRSSPDLELALHQEAAFHRAVLDTAVLGIITIKSNGTILAANPAIEQLFRRPRAELIGQHVSILMPSEHAGRHDEYVERYMKTGERRIIGIGREVEARRKDGTTFPAELAVSEVVLGGEHYFTGLFHDVTERKRAEEELRRYRDELEATVEQRTAELLTANAKLEEKTAALAASNRELERFASVVAHDLRNPLSSMTMFLTVLRKLHDEGRTDEAANYLSLALDTSKQMQRLITDVLSYSRLSSERAAPEDVDCEALLRDVAQALQASIRGAGATVECDALPTVNAHRTELAQIFQNLIQNAISYGGEGHTVVRVSCEEREEGWLFSVEDNGIGIAEQDRAAVFEPFRRFHEDSRAPGLGLGLAICKKLITSRGGEIGFDSTPGRGTRFWFALPRRSL